MWQRYKRKGGKKTTRKNNQKPKKTQGKKTTSQKLFQFPANEPPPPSRALPRPLPNASGRRRTVTLVTTPDLRPTGQAGGRRPASKNEQDGALGGDPRNLQLLIIGLCKRSHGFWLGKMSRYFGSWLWLINSGMAVLPTKRLKVDGLGMCRQEGGGVGGGHGWGLTWAGTRASGPGAPAALGTRRPSSGTGPRSPTTSGGRTQTRRRHKGF